MIKINNALPDKQKYLQIISTIARSPLSLYYIGELPAERRPSVSIIGTRRLSPYGREASYRLAYELAQQGVVIISGLALGLDSVAHQAALDAGGTTIAVLPGGLDRIYPASHRALAQRIINGGGALISECKPGTAIYPSSFIARNRIVAGLCDGLLVVEAAARSGTMHTANFALEQGKAVMAVPGNITSQTSEGCNNLIASGARLIRSTDDVLQEIGLGSLRQTALPLADTAEEATLISLIAAGEREGYMLQQKSGLAPEVFSRTLSLLEIGGKIRALGGNQWSL